MPIKVYDLLLVEDQAPDAQLVQNALGRCDYCRFNVHRAARLTEALDQLSGKRYDAILLDLSLPDSQGTDTIKQIHEQAPDTPVVVLTGLSDEDAALEALDYGAHNYLVKGELAMYALGRTICFAVKHRQLETERDAAIEQLETAKQALELKNRRLAQLYDTAHRSVDDVSHEFRTPLTVIKEYCSIIQDGLVGTVNDEQRHLLEIVSDRVQDLNIMVNDMLDSSRLKAGLLGIRRRQCAVAEIVEHAWALLVRKAAVRNIRLESKLDENLPDVFCDPEKASRVLVNLALNAIKCVPEGGEVRILARRNPDLNDILVGVTDNGPGIREEDLAFIFGRFKQLKEGTCDGTKGFGLGLSIALELVRLNLGDITVDSKLGRGTTFTFTLPVADLTTVASRHVTQVLSSPDGAPGLLVVLHIDEHVGGPLAEEVDAFLQNLVRHHDLLYRVDERKWLLIAAVNPLERSLVTRRIEQEWEMANRNRPQEPLPPLRYTIPESPQLQALMEGSTEGNLDTVLENAHA